MPTGFLSFNSLCLSMQDMDPASVSVRVVGGQALEVQAPGCSQARVEVPFYVDKRVRSGGKSLLLCIACVAY